MTKIAWTGTRLPASGFTPEEEAIIAQDVALAGLCDGDSVASGLCDGVDECVMLLVARMREATGRSTRIVGFPPGPAHRGRRVTQRAWDVCDEIVETADGGGDPKARDRSLVAWADVVRAIPRYPCERRGKRQQLFVIGQPRSGTGYTMRLAEAAGKLVNVEPLRPPLDGRVVEPIRLNTAGDVFPPAATGTWEASQFHVQRLVESRPGMVRLSEAEVLDVYRSATEADA